MRVGLTLFARSMHMLICAHSARTGLQQSSKLLEGATFDVAYEAGYLESNSLPDRVHHALLSVAKALVSSRVHTRPYHVTHSTRNWQAHVSDAALVPCYLTRTLPESDFAIEVSRRCNFREPPFTMHG